MVFYTQLQFEVEESSNHDIMVITGDFNAKVGSDWDTWKRAIGKFGYGQENDRGERLLHLCLNNNFVITNTMFAKKMLTGNGRGSHQTGKPRT